MAKKSGILMQNQQRIENNNAQTLPIENENSIKENLQEKSKEGEN